MTSGNFSPIERKQQRNGFIIEPIHKDDDFTEEELNHKHDDYNTDSSISDASSEASDVDMSETEQEDEDILSSWFGGMGNKLRRLSNAGLTTANTVLESISWTAKKSTELINKHLPTVFNKFSQSASSTTAVPEPTPTPSPTTTISANQHSGSSGQILRSLSDTAVIHAENKTISQLRKTNPEAAAQRFRQRHNLHLTPQSKPKPKPATRLQRVGRWLKTKIKNGVQWVKENPRTAIAIAMFVVFAITAGVMFGVISEGYWYAPLIWWQKSTSVTEVMSWGTNKMAANIVGGALAMSSTAAAGTGVLIGIGVAIKKAVSKIKNYFNKEDAAKNATIVKIEDPKAATRANNNPSRSTSMSHSPELPAHYNSPLTTPLTARVGKETHTDDYDGIHFTKANLIFSNSGRSPRCA